MTKEQRDALLYQPKNGYDRLTQAEEQELNAYCEAYKSFLDRSKTERECVFTAIAEAEARGFVAYHPGMPIKTGDKLYWNNRGKAIMLAVIGEEDLSHGANIGAAHTDAPRLDIKPNPLYEDTELAYLKTHHYGGIRKYQWVTVPLELHGRLSAAMEARFTSPSEMTPPTRSSSSRTFCLILGVSRAKSPSTKQFRLKA